MINQASLQHRRRQFTLHVTGIAVVLAMVASVLAAPATAGVAVPETVGQVDPATGIWTLRTESGTSGSFYFGNPGDTPFAGDWDCDGIDTPGLYRVSDGFVYLRNSNTQGVANVSYFFGNPGDIPLAGDFNGDGCDTVSLYRPSEGRVYVINKLGSGDAGVGPADSAFYFGNPSDAPFAGDFTGDNTDTVGLYRESSGLTYLRFVNEQGNADAQFFFGDAGDRFVAGDWNNDGVSTPGVFRPNDTTFYLKNSNVQGNADISFMMGSSGSLPIAGRWGEIAVQPELTTEIAASGFNQPLLLTAPVGDARLFVVEKTGAIRIVQNGQTLATPFLTVPGISTNSERGLLGLAFHPDYATNGRFFVNFTNGSGDTRVVEYSASPGANVANPTPVATLLSVDQPANNHNGGMIAFDSFGYLLVALGDGGGATSTAQDLDDPLGSMLRLDVDAAAPSNAAPGNPYIGVAGDDRIWANGLRNPWRFSVDRATGDLYIGDVGEVDREEINYAAAGEGGLNFGWARTEGTLCFPIGSSCDTTGIRFPVISYPRSVGRTVTGGYVYRGAEIPALAGTYLYGDFITGFVGSARIVGGVATDSRDRTSELGGISNLASFGEDGSGELYMVSLNGTIYKIIEAP